MEEESEMPVFTFVQKGESLTEAGSSGETLSENGIIYLTINEDNVTENSCGESTSYFVPHNAVFDTSTVLNSQVKILTLGNEQYFYIPEDDDDEFNETVQPLDQQLISSEITTGEQAINEIASTESSNFTLDEGAAATEAEDTVIKVLEPYEMIMVNNDDVDPLAIPETKKKFKCLYKGCEKFYSTSQHLTVHMRNHMNSKPFPCSFAGCGKKFATNYSLTAHWRTHTGEKPYTCQVCTKSFKTSGDLMKHVRIHTGEKPFMCPIEGCGKSFTTSNIRKVHVRSHTGERPYVCDYPNCGKAFASSTNYKNHARIHSGEKPYVCSVKGCDKKFTEYSSLYKHQAVHQVDKPYECDYCKQKFKSEHTLNVHRKVKHGVLVSPDGIRLLDLESIGLANSHS